VGSDPCPGGVAADYGLGSLFAWTTADFGGDGILLPWVRSILIAAAGLMVTALVATPIADPQRSQYVALSVLPIALGTSFLIGGRWNRVSVDRLIREVQTSSTQPPKRRP
jgi:hypothetical protein